MPAAPLDPPSTLARVLATVLATVLALGLAVGLPALRADAAERAPARTDVAAARADLDAATAGAAALAGALEQAAARDGGLRQALADLAEQSDAAQARLDARVRQVFVQGGRDPLDLLAVRIGAPALQRVARQGLSASVRAERDLLDAAAAQSSRVRTLQARSDAFRARLRAQAGAVLTAQDRARILLGAARSRAAAALAAEQATGARRAAIAVEQQRLAAVAQQLDAVSAAVTRSLSPAQTARGRRAQEREAPLLALAEAAGAGYPTGYRPSGDVVRGTASWYGPGFVGSPTASSAPYDPERLSCASRELPLGTLLRVSHAGRSVVCLVNDRGPYVGDRVLDLSRAGSRTLGYDGTAEVVAEVLAPQ